MCLTVTSDDSGNICTSSAACPAQTESDQTTRAVTVRKYAFVPRCEPQQHLTQRLHSTTPEPWPRGVLTECPEIGMSAHSPNYRSTVWGVALTFRSTARGNDDGAYSSRHDEFMTSHDDPAVTAWLIRHGQSTSNAGRVTVDLAMIPLSDTGKQQADVVARGFEDSPDLIVTSPFLRARDTAVSTTKRFPSVPVTQWPVEEFTYLGHLHGRRTTGLERRPLVDAPGFADTPMRRQVRRAGVVSNPTGLIQSRVECLWRLQQTPGVSLPPPRMFPTLA